LVEFSGKDWSSQHREGLKAPIYGALWLSRAVRSGFIIPSPNLPRLSIPYPKNNKTPPKRGFVYALLITIKR